MPSDRSWRSDPSVKWALSRKGGGLQPWDVMLVNCPSIVCGAQNYFLGGSTTHCRRCGEFLGDRADEMYSVGVAMELEYEHLRLEALGQVEEIVEQPFDGDKSSTEMKPPPEIPPGSAVITAFWILLCIGVLAAMAALSHFLDGRI